MIHQFLFNKTHIKNIVQIEVKTNVKSLKVIINKKKKKIITYTSLKKIKES
jgi:hypothetical protein